MAGKAIQPGFCIPHFRAIAGTREPFPGFVVSVRLSLSSTWGRADQQTSQDSN
jgi:hypothetical protein